MKKEKWDNLNELDLVDNYVKSERGIEPDPSLVSKLISSHQRMNSVCYDQFDFD